MPDQTTQSALLEWYNHNRRALPWRRNRDPYLIWISETMLQQTTTTAVIPFFERFTSRFPDLKTLADAPESAVVEAWAGLGYYSRARNLHRSARALVERGGFPQTYQELIELPGFGPYTSRSVASLAFDQAVGVVDGNVVRVLSRFEAEAWDWWQPKVRDQIQTHADAWVKNVSPYQMNQALMELGRTICTPKSPGCLLCPIRPKCGAYKQDLVKVLPKPRPRRGRELWAWEARVCVQDGRILLERNTGAPFLRGQWLLPATARRLMEKPARYDYRHSITHHDIFVTVRPELPTISEGTADLRWVELKEIRQHVPVSLVTKALLSLEPADPARLPVRAPARRRAKTKHDPKRK